VRTGLSWLVVQPVGASELNLNFAAAMVLVLFCERVCSYDACSACVSMGASPRCSLSGPVEGRQPGPAESSLSRQMVRKKAWLQGYANH
jgi:hypothetical protein